MTNKALEILEEILEDDEYADSDCTASGFYKDYIEKAIAELKAKDKAYAKLQQAYDSLTAQYQKDVNELEAKLEQIRTHPHYDGETKFDF